MFCFSENGLSVLLSTSFYTFLDLASEGEPFQSCIRTNSTERSKENVQNIKRTGEAESTNLKRQNKACSGCTCHVHHIHHSRFHQNYRPARLCEQEICKTISILLVVFHCLDLLTFSIHSLQVTLPFSLSDCLIRCAASSVFLRKRAHSWSTGSNQSTYSLSGMDPPHTVLRVSKHCSERLERVVLVFDDFLTKVTKVHQSIIIQKSM